MPSSGQLLFITECRSYDPCLEGAGHKSSEQTKGVPGVRSQDSSYHWVPTDQEGHPKEPGTSLHLGPYKFIPVSWTVEEVLNGRMCEPSSLRLEEFSPQRPSQF